jgi:hypothetical protein
VRTADKRTRSANESETVSYQGRSRADLHRSPNSWHDPSARGDPAVADANHVCHELTALTRPGLIAGTIDLILDHDLTRLARSAIKMLIDIKAAAPGKKQSAIVPFTIYTSENI